MPLLGFSRLKDKLLDGSKTQTIRLPRKHPIRKGDKVYIYWHLRQKDCQKLGEGIVTKIERKTFSQFTEDDAKKDGFNNVRPELLNTLLELHSELDIFTAWDVITWKWTKR